MQVTLELPEDIVAQMTSNGGDISRAALEGLALEGYRSGRLSEAQIRRLLGFGTRHRVHGFLKQHGIPLRYTEHDLDQDLETAGKLAEK